MTAMSLCVTHHVCECGAAKLERLEKDNAKLQAENTKLRVLITKTTLETRRKSNERAIKEAKKERAQIANDIRELSRDLDQARNFISGHIPPEDW